MRKKIKLSFLSISFLFSSFSFAVINEEKNIHPNIQSIDYALNIETKLILNTESPFTFIDLFCGCGGSSLGFENAGFKLIAGVDNDKHAVEAYQQNFPNSLCLKEDLNTLTPEELMKQCNLKTGELTCLLASPPCQPYSPIANQFEEKTSLRKDAYKLVIQFVETLQPKWLFLENVYAKNTKKEKSFIKIIDEKIIPALKNLNYNVDYKILNAKDYGFPQNRIRIILVANYEGKKICWPSPFETQVSVKNAIGDLASIAPIIFNKNERTNRDLGLIPYNNSCELTDYQSKMRGMNRILSDHMITQVDEKHIPFMNQVHAQPKTKNTIKCIRVRSRETYRTLIAENVSPTITHNPNAISADGGLIHYEHNRPITPREAARLQGFSDKILFTKSARPSFKLIGNAVPPPLAEIVASSIIQAEISNLGKREFQCDEIDSDNNFKKMKLSNDFIEKEDFSN
jgi:DNA (cytosine-5)-methyltransferase 1